jgi:hypothetical protein
MLTYTVLISKTARLEGRSDSQRTSMELECMITRIFVLSKKLFIFLDTNMIKS